jgi:hypothetical protein
MVYDNDGPVYSMLNGKVSCEGNGDCEGLPQNCGCFYEKSYSTQPWDPPTSCPSGFVSTPDPRYLYNPETDAYDIYCSNCVSCQALVQNDCNQNCPASYNGVDGISSVHVFQTNQICCDGFCTKGVDANGWPAMSCP